MPGFLRMSVRLFPAFALLVGLLPSLALAQNKHVFVSSELTDGSITELALTGIAAADAICTRLALASTALPATAKADPWKAWISDGTGSPSTAFSQATIPYRLTNLTTIVAINYTDLIDGALPTPINRDENGTVVSADFVWTGTQFDGTFDPLALSVGNCADWTSIVGQSVVGITSQTGVGWTDAGGSITCGDSYHLYCFQQGVASLPVTLQKFSVE